MVGLYQKGITLIELIITLALVAVIIASIAPLGRSWIATAHVSKAQSVLTQAFNKSKTEALRNPNKVLSDATNPTVATITINNTAKTVTVTNSSSATIWNDSFDQDTTITLPTACSSKILLNNTVQLLNSSTPATIDNTCSSYTISASSAQSVTGVLR
ncbi:pilus assembly FimT family protein [Acinetobacter sp. ANC 4636]|uniref:pilus assembly FimT family protein n=1 Tax=Acinetobacter sp. ANC 4635 TaxID=2529846 RepID=UPI0010388508|nr:prepilin-type N-terminal cleavage/methylation domain-containing protein [Acinetobacter sp. ANC 4635]TCB32500.1 prepilin-type N-terminal cleavage/methylation domain-containing protein [Acinetobacter sp. ANC 4635]